MTGPRWEEPLGVGELGDNIADENVADDITAAGDEPDS